MQLEGRERLEMSSVRKLMREEAGVHSFTSF